MPLPIYREGLDPQALKCVLTSDTCVRSSVIRNLAVDDSFGIPSAGSRSDYPGWMPAIALGAFEGEAELMGEMQVLWTKGKLPAAGGSVSTYTIETVTFLRENDGIWRAAGYYIKPKL